MALQSLVALLPADHRAHGILSPDRWYCHACIQVGDTSGGCDEIGHYRRSGTCACGKPGHRMVDSIWSMKVRPGHNIVLWANDNVWRLIHVSSGGSRRLWVETLRHGPVVGSAEWMSIHADRFISHYTRALATVMDT
jgi:hypothetical protein